MMLDKSVRSRVAKIHQKTQIKFTYQMSESGMSVEFSITMTFTDYGTTVITETVAE